MSLPRRLASFTLLLALTLTLVFAVAAPALAGTDGTPEPGGTPAAGLGEEATILDDTGENEIATVSVDSIVDPFEDYDEFGAPEANERYVAVEYTVTNLIPNDSIDSPTYYLSLLTTDGAQYTSTYIFLPEDSDYEEFPTDAILGDESATGYVFYLVPEDAEISSIYYTSYNQFLLVAGLSESATPELGDTVTAADDERGEFAAVAVTEYLDPVEDYAEFYEPESGFRYVGVTVEIENLVENDGLDVYDSDFALVSAEGFLYTYGFFQAEDEDTYEIFESGRLRGGESISGTIFFTVPEDAEITGVIYRPISGVTLNLGDPSA